MKTTRFNKVSSQWLKVISLSFIIFHLSFSPARAQKAGDIISGTVSDAFGPVMMANVVEMDAANRIVASAVTDMSGNFSFKLKNPKDKLRITYVGCKTVTLPFNKTHYNVVLQDATQIQEVTITATKRAQGSGLAIPQKEISTARQSIDMKEFEGLSMTTVDEALQGRIAGLDIVANSGNLGSGTSMRLRGVSSINGSSEPLIVVDGNVWETGNTKDFDFSSANDEKFAELLNVNPEDIESIAVLKDAAATAIWGSQGANGVIEIKTKRGARGNTRVTYSLRLTGTYQPEGMKLLNGDEYTMMLKEEYFNPRLQAGASDNIDEINYKSGGEFSEYQMYNENTDWVKAVKKTGWRQNHYVALSGGGEKANFRIAAGYDHETGSIIKQQLDRFTTRVALDYFVSDRIKIATNVALTYTDNHKNYADLLSVAYRRMPNLAIYEQDRDGKSLGTYYNMLPTVNEVFRENQLSDYNPIALANLAKSEESSYNIEPEFKLNYELLGIENEKTRLTYEGKIVFNIFNRYNDMFRPLSLSTGGWSSSDANLATNNAYKSLGITTTHTLTFVPQFTNKDHSLMMMLRGQLTKGTSTSQNTSEYGLPSGTIISASAPGIISSFGSSPGQWRSIYLTYSAHYAYKGRYVVDFSVRRDGSTKFGPDQRWGNFPALSGKWIVSDEPWFKDNLPFVSMLAIRPGWGIVGNQPGGEGLFYSKYTGGKGYMDNGSVYQSNVQLKNLKWEQKETVNLGFDFGFWNDRFNGNVEVYKQKTTDLLMGNRSLPSSSGFSSLAYQNVGAMENVGWEFNLNGNRIIKAGQFSVDFNITFANNRNKLTEMDETVLASLNGDFDRNNGSYLSRVELNRPLGGIYGFRYKGVYQYSKYSETEVPGVSGPNAPVARDENGMVILDNYGRTKPMVFCYTGVEEEDKEFHGGDAIYEDVNHDGQINELDIVYLGSSLPKFTGGFGIKFHWGRLTLNNQFNFRYGNKIINKARMNAENMYSNNNQSLAVLWRWRVEGDDMPIPRALYNYGYNWLGSDRFVEDGSFIRLNYTQLSYALSPKTLKKLGLSQLSLYISANNLFVITKYSGADPEVGYGGYGVVTDNAQTPRAKSFTGGITVSF
ncbi:MAG: SusC/RagA family TonB-linked outer membrane protein [Prevotella sp.]|nr:SusC/RagA family TonB-linked outer membrane protein [Prevotella sp.]